MKQKTPRVPCPCWHHLARGKPSCGKVPPEGLGDRERRGGDPHVEPWGDLPPSGDRGLPVGCDQARAHYEVQKLCQHAFVVLGSVGVQDVLRDLGVRHNQQFLHHDV